MTGADERREVAERLRNRGNDLYSLFYTRLARRVFGDDAWGNKSENEIFDKLADLIDPTFEVVPFDKESMRLPHCSVCGQPMLKPWPNHCPNCGARLVSERW